MLKFFKLFLMDGGCMKIVAGVGDNKNILRLVKA